MYMWAQIYSHQLRITSSYSLADLSRPIDGGFVGLDFIARKLDRDQARFSYVHNIC